jgi:hypothetical protein
MARITIAQLRELASTVSDPDAAQALNDKANEAEGAGESDVDRDETLDAIGDAARADILKMLGESDG